MARKSRYQGYLNGMKEYENQKSRRKAVRSEESHSSPKSILAKLKALKGQAAVVTVPIGGTNE